MPAVIRVGLADAQPNRIARDAAEVILSGLSYSHRAGTARLACEQVFDARSLRARSTGSPARPARRRFRTTTVSLDELARLCAAGVAARPRAETARVRAAAPVQVVRRGVPRPIPTIPRWTKAIGVLTERNWLADTGRIHGAGDHGPNPAAEIAMQIAGRHVGVLPGSAP